MINRHAVFILGVMMSLASGCGGEKRKNKPNAGGPPGTQGMFQSAARTYGIPSRFLLAAAYLESGITPIKSTSLYANNGNGKDGKLGVRVGETAFGLTREKLGLPEDDGLASSLETQIDAYCRLLKAEVLNAKLNLPANPTDSETKFRWIWQMAQVHRDGIAQRRNVQVLFAKELTDLLNKGFEWQNPKSGEFISFPPENPPIKNQDLALDQQKLFRLNTPRAEIANAKFFPLTRVDSGERQNHPRRIEIVHCPFTLSGCLELLQHKDNDVEVGAHYIVPAEITDSTEASELVTQVFQVAHHEEVVEITPPSGGVQFIDDAIVIMLSGRSGRINNGVRDPARPGWYTVAQLKALGNLVNDLCLMLSNDPTIKMEECVSMKGSNGLHFHQQGVSEVLRWGDIPDFDETIFAAYIANPTGLPGGDASFEFGRANRFTAGQAVPIKAVFSPSARIVELEELVRCPDGKLVWSSLSTEHVRAASRIVINKTFWDAGPNGNGEHHFRIRVFAGIDELIGWDVANIFLQKYDTDASSFSSKECLRNGN
jgi:hypothetical protein